MKRLALAAGVALALALAPAATAAPCSPAAKAGIKVTDPAGGGAFYATHELRVSPTGTGTGTFFASLSAPGARRLEDDRDTEAAQFVRDSPGPLTISGVVETDDPANPSEPCTANVSRTIALRVPLAPLITYKRPRKFRARGKLLYQAGAPFFIVVKPRTGSDRSPITVRARVVKRPRLPSAKTKPVIRVLGQRSSDYPANEPPQCSLVCTKAGPRGFRYGTKIDLLPPRNFNAPVNGFRLRLHPHDGYLKNANTRRERLVSPGFGVDIEVLQSGRRIARLRVAGRCITNGQSDRCKFKRVKTGG